MIRRNISEDTNTNLTDAETSLLDQYEDEQLEDQDTAQHKLIHIPIWSAYHSMIGDVKCVMRVVAPPLIAAPAHEWQTMLTVLKKAQGISTKVIGSDRKTVISLDMGLYRPAKQLQMARDDMDNFLLRTGELHIVMAELRSIGGYIDNSGIDLSWIEANLYGPVTVKQILNCNHIARGLTAHIVSLEALFNLYQEAFFEQHLELKDDEQQKSNKNDVQYCHANLINVIESLDVMDIYKMSRFDASKCSHPLVKFTRQYMQMVMEMMVFIRAVRTGDWNLHLWALETFTKYFFVHDQLNYARMIPLYLAEMSQLKQSDPEIYQEFRATG